MVEVIVVEKINNLIIANYTYATDIESEVKIKLASRYTRETRLMVFPTNEGSKYYPVNQLTTGSIKNLKVYLNGSSEERKVLEIIKSNNLPVNVIITLKDGSSYNGSNMYIVNPLVFESNHYLLDFEGHVSRIENSDSSDQLVGGKETQSTVVA